MKLSSRFTFVAIGLALAMALITLIAQARETSSAAKSAAPPSDPEIAAPGARRVVAEGRLAAYPGAEITVSSEVAGVVVGLPFAELDRVESGYLVAQLRADDLLAEAAAADARVGEAEAEVRLAESELVRAENLLAKQVDTAARRDRAQRDLDVARARRVTAQADVQRLEARIAKYRIAVPIGGIIVRRFVERGQAVEAGQPIVTVADLDRVRVEAEVDEFDAGRVRVGAPVRVTAEGYDGDAWTGAVEEIPSAVSGRVLKPQDPGKPSDTRILLVKIRLEGKTPLKLGQRVEVAIEG